MQAALDDADGLSGHVITGINEEGEQQDEATEPAVPREGAKEPDTRSQGGPHLEAPALEAETMEGAEPARVPASGGSDLNAPPTGPPQAGPWPEPPPLEHDRPAL